MANMGYCRFRNTLGDLRDCEEDLSVRPFEELNKDEQRACQRLYGLCRRFVLTYEDDMTTPEYRESRA